MRGAIVTSFDGGAEALEVRDDLPEPVAGEGEVRIRVTRAGVNFADLHQREDRYVERRTLPFVPGAEVVGVREDTGERVVALTGVGGYAELAVAPAAHTFAVPDDVGDDEALAVLVQGLSAWHALRTSAALRRGDSVVVVSAAGGVGSLATQLARPLGAGRVIATASSDEKRALALELGADVAIDGAAEGLGERLREANGGAPVDVVLEIAGGAVFDACLRALAPLGRLVVLGISSKQGNDVRSGHLLKHSRAVVGFWLFHLLDRPALIEEALADLFARVGDGSLRVVVGGAYGLGEVHRAHADLAARRTTGKLLLDPAR